MVHKEYIRNRGSNTAILMIHGILGTPRHFDSLISAFPEEWDIYNILLDGHGGSVKDFAETSMEKWKAQVDGMFCELCRKYENIYILAHSMGTLLAMRAALKRPKKIRAMFLLDVPLKMQFTPKAFVNCLKVALDKVSPDDSDAVATKNSCSITTTKKLWEYIPWSARYLELFALAEKVETRLFKLTAPCLVFQSRYDELVQLSALGPLKKLPNAEINILKTSGHFSYSKEDTEFLKRRIKRYCNNKQQRKIFRLQHNGRNYSERT